MSKIPPPLTSLLEKVTLIFAKIPSLARILHTDRDKETAKPDGVRQASTGATPSFTSAIEFRKKSHILTLLRPGTQEGAWQLWKMPSKKEETAELHSGPILLEPAVPPPLASSKTDWIIGVPTRDLIAVPLWVASQGNLEELVMLELSSKHLLRRGMSEGLKIITLEIHDDRTLVVVLAPAAIPSMATASYLKTAEHFEAAARLLPTENTDLLLWHELGEICFAFIKKNQCLWFSGSSETEVNSFLIGLIKRMALHLHAESVLDHMPRSVRMIGPFSTKECELLQRELGIAEKSCDHHVDIPSPVIPKPLLDLPSEQARHERVLQAKRDQIKKIVTFALMGYCFLIFSGAVNLLLKESLATRFSHQLTRASAPIEKANHDLAEWQEFRFAIDPRTYALDLLAAVASQLHGEKIRLISLASIDGRLQISGEATDVSQAYHFLESIKTAPDLQEYQWTSSQPKLAGKNSVRFETEGSLPHAKTSSE
ncbi:MAG: hypothetical protein ACOYK6_02350 [Chthoniobacterales bacterium]